MDLFPVQQKIKNLFFEHNPKWTKLILGQRSGKTYLSSEIIKGQLKANHRAISIVLPHVEDKDLAESLGKDLYPELRSKRIKYYSRLKDLPKKPQFVLIDEFLWSYEGFYEDYQELLKKGYDILMVSSMKDKNDLEKYFDGKGLEVCLPTHKANPDISKDFIENEIKDPERDYLCYGHEAAYLDGERIEI